MTNQKHNPSPKVKSTPGPWYFNGDLTVRSRHLGKIADCNMGQGLDKDIANARLIAAAPELLEACNALHDALSAILEDTDNTILGASLRKQANKAVNISFRAIAKAEGGAE